VTELVAKSVDLREVKKMYPKLAVYMMRNISIMLSISSVIKYPVIILHLLPHPFTFLERLLCFDQKKMD